MTFGKITEHESKRKSVYFIKCCLRSDLITVWGRIVLETVVQGRAGCKEATKTPAVQNTSCPLDDCLDLVENSQLLTKPSKEIISAAV